MLNKSIVKLGLVKVVLFSGLLLSDQPVYAMFRAIPAVKSEGDSSRFDLEEPSEESDSEVSLDPKRYDSPIERLGRIPYAEGSFYGFTYPYFELMNFQHGDLIYGIHVVRQIAMEAVRAHERERSRSFGAITADHFNKLIFFDPDHEKSILAQVEESEKKEMIHVVGLDRVDYRRFKGFLDQILRRLGLRSIAEWREVKESMIEGGRGFFNSESRSKDTAQKGDLDTTELRAEVSSEEEFYKMACDQAIRYTHSIGAKIHFILDGVSSLDACDSESPLYNSYTSHELRVIFKLWMKEFMAEMAGEGGGLESVAAPTGAEGSASRILETVRFYRHGDLVSAPWLDHKGKLLPEWAAWSVSQGF